MRFSTSDSDPFPLIFWAPAILIAVLIGGAWEAFLRSHGVEQQPQDSAALWNLQRTRADTLGADAVVLTGTSRIRNGFDPEILSRRFAPSRFLMLAVDGASLQPLVHELAMDPRFVGTVVGELSDHVLTGRDAPREASLRNYLRHRDEASPFEGWDLCRDDRSERWWLADERDIAARRDDILGAWRHPVQPIRPREGLKADIHAITARGGRFIFVDPIASTALRALDVARRPIAEREAFARDFGALYVNCNDVPDRDRIAVPDGVHVDARWVDRYTEECADLLAPALRR